MKALVSSKLHDPLGAPSTKQSNKSTRRRDQEWPGEDNSQFSSRWLRVHGHPVMTQGTLSMSNKQCNPSTHEDNKICPGMIPIDTTMLMYVWKSGEEILPGQSTPSQEVACLVHTWVPAMVTSGWMRSSCSALPPPMPIQWRRCLSLVRTPGTSTRCWVRLG